MSSVDAHVHLWNRSTDPQPWIDADTMGAIDRDFGVAELDGMLARCDVGRAIVVQAANSAPETGRLLALAESGTTARSIAGVVGWLDLTGDVDAQLAAMGDDRSGLVGVRHLVHLDDDPRWLARADIGHALDRLAAHDLGFDLVLRSGQLSLAADVASAHPDTRFVLDHLGGIAETGDWPGWESGLGRLAGRPNVTAKLSGLASMATEADRQRKAIDVALEAFTPARLMYGSDWPLTELSTGVLAWRTVVHDTVAGLSAEERERIASGTATRHYGLEPA